MYSGGPRRRSLYNFFLKHQDAVEKPDSSSAATSPVTPRKEFKVQGKAQISAITLHSLFKHCTGEASFEDKFGNVRNYSRYEKG